MTICKTRNGNKLSNIAFGTSGSGSFANYSDDKFKSKVDLFYQVFQSGINFFDTAELYGGGLAEHILGAAFREVREDVFIASKFNPTRLNKNDLMSAFEQSLQRLQTDYIDLYQFHWPNTAADYGEIFFQLNTLKRQGKIRYIGISNFSFNELLELEKNNYLKDVSFIEILFNFGWQIPLDDLIPFCRKHNITVLAYSPLGQGKLISKIQAYVEFEIKRSSLNLSTSQVLMNWLTNQENIIPVFRSSNINHVKEIVMEKDIQPMNFVLESIKNKIQPKIIDIPLSCIKLSNIDGRQIYKSVEEAIKNEFDWIPSPESLSKRLSKYQPIEPLILNEHRDVNSVHYTLDAYDFLGENKKFWAWIIAEGFDGNAQAILA
jgi:aryl-alcohol dehydrogenase-like predicted oxidoreductase